MSKLKLEFCLLRTLDLLCHLLVFYYLVKVVNQFSELSAIIISIFFSLFLLNYNRKYWGKKVYKK